MLDASTPESRPLDDYRTRSDSDPRLIQRLTLTQEEATNRFRNLSGDRKEWQRPSSRPRYLTESLQTSTRFGSITTTVSGDSGVSSPNTKSPEGKESFLWPPQPNISRGRSNSIVYMVDPSVSRLQLTPSSVEPIRAKLFKQKKDLAPQWVKMSIPDISPSSTVYDVGNNPSGQMQLSVPSPLRKVDKPGLLEPNNTGNTEYGQSHQARRFSLFSINNSIPIPDGRVPADTKSRPRSRSRGLSDLFRLRRKSINVANPVALSPAALPSDLDESQSKAVEENHSKSFLKATKKNFLPNFTRQRSRSTVEPPIFSELRHKSTERPERASAPEPISVRVFNSQVHSTSMSELLSKQLGPDQQKPVFGIREYLELYKSHHNSDPRLSESRTDGRRTPNRRLSSNQQPTADDLSLSLGSDDDPDRTELEMSNVRSKTIPPNLESSLPESIPEYMEVHQVSSSSNSSLQQRRGACWDGVDATSLAAHLQSRRFSEPVKPNLRQMSVLNSINMKLVSSQDRHNDGISQKLKSPPDIARALGLQMPIITRHKLLLWRDKDSGVQLLKLPLNCQDDHEDLYNFTSNDSETFVKLMKLHKCHELMPHSAMLVLLDSELEMTSAFYALMYHGIKAAPIWNYVRRDFVGMLTATDFIRILQMYYNSPDEFGNFEEHKISKWLDLLRGPEPSVVMTIDPDETLYEAVLRLSANKVRRLLVADDVKGMALYVLSYRRILHFIYLLMHEVEQPSYMNQSIWELKIGTYDDNLCTVTHNSPLIDALNLLVEKRVSALPVVDNDGRLINIYAKSDVYNLALNHSYKNLNITVADALKGEREGFEGVYLCKKTDTLRQVIQWIIQANIHRLLVVEDDRVPNGIVSLSDIVHFLVIRQIEGKTGSSFTPGDVEEELKLSLTMAEA